MSVAEIQEWNDENHHKVCGRHVDRDDSINNEYVSREEHAEADELINLRMKEGEEYMAKHKRLLEAREEVSNVT